MVKLAFNDLSDKIRTGAVKADYELTADVLCKLSPPVNGIQLARYTQQGITALKHKIADRIFTPVSGIQIREETVEDWRYPVHVLDTETVAQMQGADFRTIRNKFRAAAKNITIVALEPGTALRHMRAALKFWEGTMIQNQKDTPGMSDMYEELFQVVQNHPSATKGLAFYQGRRPVGLSVWDRPYADTSNLSANLADISVRGLSDFQVVSVCRMLKEEGIKYMNFGGSERESLDDFKAKFKPVKTIDLLSAEVIYTRPANDNIQKFTIVEDLANTLS